MDNFKIHRIFLKMNGLAADPKISDQIIYSLAIILMLIFHPNYLLVVLDLNEPPEIRRYVTVTLFDYIISDTLSILARLNRGKLFGLMENLKGFRPDRSHTQHNIIRFKKASSKGQLK